MHRILLIILSTLLISTSYSQNWRSTLYPEVGFNPEVKNFYSDKVIQDFSYAGYHRGEISIPSPTSNIVDVTKAPFNADKTGSVDATSAIQAAINSISNSGGVVYLPQGTYKLSPGSNDYCLEIASSNVVLRGEGIDKTFLLNSSSVMNRKNIIDISGSGSWTSTGNSSTTITQDLMKPTKKIPVASVSGYNEGDVIIIRIPFNDDWIADHNMESYWGGSNGEPSDIIYCREVLKVDQTNKILEIDIPIRYAIKTNYSPKVYIARTMITEVGLENFSIGNVQSTKAGYAESDYNVSGTGGYDCDESYVIFMQRAYNCWIKNVNSYKPSANTNSAAHILSNGIRVNQTKNVTIVNCDFESPQYGGGGGNGYMYRIMGNETLIKDCNATFSRHGFVLSHAIASGNVFYNCVDTDGGKQRELDGNGNTSGKGSDHHMHFSHSNLFDKCSIENSYYEARWRPYGSSPEHNLTAAHTVYWNLESNGNQSYAVRTEQARYGYVIGTKGDENSVSTTGSGPKTITDPVDHVEGVGQAAKLEPQSLYADQFFMRTGKNPATGISDEGLKSKKIVPYPNPSYGVFNLNEKSSWEAYSILGNKIDSGNGKVIDLQNHEKGIYLIKLTDRTIKVVVD